jgi:hypothetical protein
MLKQFLLRTLAITAIVVIGASAAIAARLNIESVVPSAAPTNVLPAISKPRPYQKSVVVTCDKQLPVATPFTCLMALGPVPAKHVLELSTINCVGGGSLATVIFKNLLKLEAANLVGFFPDATGQPIGVASGPYYFNAGDKPYLVRSAGSAGERGLCMVHGTMWETP